MASSTAPVNWAIRVFRNSSCGPLVRRVLTSSLSSRAACATVNFFMAGTLLLIGWWNFHSRQGTPAANSTKEATQSFAPTASEAGGCNDSSEVFKHE